MTGLVEKIVDKCTRSDSPNVQPAPSTNNKDRRLLGLAFDKLSPYDYLANCDTYVVRNLQLHDP